MVQRTDKLTLNQRLTKWYWLARDYLHFRGRSPHHITHVSRPGELHASIIIPVLNQVDEWLRECVESALNQSVRCQVIVITSAQTSESNLELLQQLQRNPALEVYRQERPGFPAALNFGIAMAKTSRVGFLLSDDWIDPDAVKECVCYSSDIVSTGIRTYAADGLSEMEGLRIMPSQAQFERLPTLDRRALYLQHFFLFQKRKLDEVGGLDETIGDSPGIDDFDLIWVLLEHGATVTIVPKFLYNYRDHFQERLTLKTRNAVALANLGRILTKHRIPVEMRKEVIAEHRIWFGRPIHVVMEEKDNHRSPRFQKMATDPQPFFEAGFSLEEYRPHHIHHIACDGNQWRLSLSDVDGVEEPDLSIDVSVYEDSAFIAGITSEQRSKFSDRILFNAVLDFALDFGLLTVYSRANVPPFYTAGRTRIRDVEYWKVSVQENSRRIAAL